jgi:hypothetical protein
MKIRTGFVSNSSSSSFVVPRAALTPAQIAMIVNHIETAQFLDKLNPELHWDADEGDEWTIEDDGTNLSGDTHMDNFDMATFMDQIGVPSALVEWEDGHW